MEMLYPTGTISYLLKQVSGLSHFREKKKKLFETLTDREVEVLRLIASGMKNPEVAREMDITRVTVQNHRASIRNKLDITHEADFIVYGLAFKLIKF